MSELRIITSLQNDRVKAVRALDMRKVRKETGLFVAEGASLIISGRDAGHVPDMLIYRAGSADGGVVADLIRWALEQRCDVLEVSAAVLEKLAAKDNPQALLAVYKQRWSELPATAKLAATQTWIALEEIRDPGNLGTIIRTADAAGASGIILIGTCCDPWSRECVRATMGSIFSVPLARTDISGFMSLLEVWPGDSVATHLTASKDFRKIDYRGPTLLVMGSEGPGLSDALASACRQRVRIPMAGKLDSLNLAVATALTLYQIRGPHLSST
jgi:TrmH family RNA methyltransferase